MKTVHRARYNFWLSLARVGHSFFRFAQWRSFKAYDKMGGRRRAESKTFSKVLDLVKTFVYHRFAAKK